MKLSGEAPSQDSDMATLEKHAIIRSVEIAIEMIAGGVGTSTVEGCRVLYAAPVSAAFEIRASRGARVYAYIHPFIRSSRSLS